MPPEKKLQKLSVFLIKDGVVRRDRVIREDECDAPLEIPIPSCGKGLLYVKRTPHKLPRWADIFASTINVASIGKSSSIAAALLLKAGDRHFVLAFGQGGRFLIRDDVYEERFGLLVTLNSVARNSFRCVDKQSLDSIQSHTRIQSGQETTADQFGLDVEQDMLKAVVGAP